MSLWTDETYLRNLASQLPRFKITSIRPLVANCRCPFCGDSKKNPYKARGYFYTREGKLFYSCKNCSITKTFKSVLWHVDKRLYREYKLELLRESGVTKQPKVEPPKPASTDASYDGLTNVLDLPEGHPARVYVASRRIPEHKIRGIYWTDAFMHWVNEKHLPGKFKDAALAKDEGRIVFPFKTTNGQTYGFCGRKLQGDEAAKYLTIKTDESHPKIFGSESLDWSKDVIVFEGQIDSLMFDNAVAVSGSDLSNCPVLRRDRCILCFDNEPRNADIIRSMKKAIDEGWRVFIWPDNVKGKDANQIITEDEYDTNELLTIIKSNVYQGLNATLKLNAWKKV